MAAAGQAQPGAAARCAVPRATEEPALRRRPPQARHLMQTPQAASQQNIQNISHHASQLGSSNGSEMAGNWIGTR